MRDAGKTRSRKSVGREFRAGERKTEKCKCEQAEKSVGNFAWNKLEGRIAHTSSADMIGHIHLHYSMGAQCEEELLCYSFSVCYVEHREFLYC